MLHQWANLPACIEKHVALLACVLQPCMCVNGLTATCSSKRSSDDCVILSACCQWVSSKVGVSSWLCKPSGHHGHKTPIDHLSSLSYTFWSSMALINELLNMAEQLDRQ